MTIFQFIKVILRQELRRLSGNLATIVTGAVASMIIGALFLYVFGDFIYARLPAIAPDTANDFKVLFVCAILMCAAMITRAWVQALLMSARGWPAFMIRFGASERDVNRARSRAGIILFLAVYMISVAVVARFAEASALVIGGVCAAAIPIAIKTMGLTRTRFDDLPPERAPNQSQTGMHPPLVAWRLSRIMGNNWPGSWLRVAAAIPILIGTVSLGFTGSPFIAQLGCLAGGIILAWCVPILISEDLKSTWIERQSAISHQDWIKSWQVIFTSWTRPLFLTAFVIALTAEFAGAQTGSVDWMSALTTPVLCGLLTAFPVWFAPSLAMQIDGQKTLTNIAVISLISIFIGTAIMALPLAALALPLISAEAHKYQNGRFARGSVRSMS
jgi:hypothetical protein